MNGDVSITERRYLYTGPIVGMVLSACGLQSLLEPDGYWISDQPGPIIDDGHIMLVCAGHASCLSRQNAKLSIPAWTFGTLQFWLVAYGRCAVNLTYDVINGDRNTISVTVKIPLVSKTHVKLADKTHTYRQPASNFSLLVDDVGNLIIEKWPRLRTLMKTIETQDELVGTPSGKFK